MGRSRPKKLRVKSPIFLSLLMSSSHRSKNRNKKKSCRRRKLKISPSLRSSSLSCLLRLPWLLVHRLLLALGKATILSVSTRRHRIRLCLLKLSNNGRLKLSKRLLASLTLSAMIGRIISIQSRWANPMPRALLSNDALPSKTSYTRTSCRKASTCSDNSLLLGPVRPSRLRLTDFLT